MMTRRRSGRERDNKGINNRGGGGMDGGSTMRKLGRGIGGG